MRERTLAHADTPFGSWPATVLAGALVFAPLFRGGQSPLALMALELAALGLLLAALWRPAPLGRAEWVAVAWLGLLPLLYLIPLPSDWVAHLPGRGPYVGVWRLAFGADEMPSTATLSLVPSATLAVWLTVSIPLAGFLTTRALGPRRLFGLVSVFFVVAGAEAVLGLMQFGDGATSPLYLGMQHTHFGSAVGTYTNRNHLAGLLLMALPIVLAVLFHGAGRGRGRGLRAALFGSRHGPGVLVYAALAVLLLVAITFTRSRMGLSLAILTLLLAVTAFSGRIGGDNTFGAAGTLLAIAFGLTVAIGLVPVLDRFTAAGVTEDLRWTMFNNTIVAIGKFLPFGSGPGTFSAVFPAFQPSELGRWFVNHAHNDYLEWVLEGGVLGGALALFLLYLYAAQWRRVWAAGEWSRLRFVQVGAGIGILAILLHELVDYNLHTPANLLYFSFLLGIFFSDAATLETLQAERPLRRTPNLGEEASTPLLAPTSALEPAADQIKNPFLDG